MTHLSEKEVFAKTIYAEARGEPEEGQRWAAWVIKNRARKNREYWGGNSIKDVCLKSRQFECWNDKNDIEIKEQDSYRKIRRLTDQIYDEPSTSDPTGGADHYNNPQKEGYPPWTEKCTRKRQIANHVFYKGP